MAFSGTPLWTSLQDWAICYSSLPVSALARGLSDLRAELLSILGIFAAFLFMGHGTRKVFGCRAAEFGAFEQVTGWIDWHIGNVRRVGTPLGRFSAGLLRSFWAVGWQ
jgi:uncharacterized membrane protein YphA (DoxX/SURF4 family)